MYKITIKQTLFAYCVLMFFLSFSSFYSPTFSPSSPLPFLTESCQTDHATLTEPAPSYSSTSSFFFFYRMNTGEYLVSFLYPCHYCMTKS